MKLLSADFVTSAAPGRTALTGIPRDGLAQVAFAGRSNVGKSSLINALCRAKIARTSAAPGKTRLANVYRLVAEGGAGGPGRWSVYFVDLPGYGYARGGRRTSEPVRTKLARCRRARDERTFAAIAERTSRRRHQARGCCSWTRGTRVSRPTSPPRAGWMGWASTRHVVATKIDKLSRAERARNLRTIENVFGMAAVPVSATSGEGLDALWTMIARIARDVEPRG